MEPELVKSLSTELINFEAPAFQTIVCGMDNAGGHIFVVENGGVSALDSVGFASIGAGWWHANAQMMLQGHVRSNSLAETLLMVYFAKRRAEVAPGVGAATDMLLIGPGLGTTAQIEQEHIEELEEIYRSEENRRQEAAAESVERVTKYVQAIVKAATVEGQKARSENAETASPSDDLILGDPS